MAHLRRASDQQAELLGARQRNRHLATADGEAQRRLSDGEPGAVGRDQGAFLALDGDARVVGNLLAAAGQYIE